MLSSWSFLRPFFFLWSEQELPGRSFHSGDRDLPFFSTRGSRPNGIAPRFNSPHALVAPPPLCLDESLTDSARFAQASLWPSAGEHPVSGV